METVMETAMEMNEIFKPVMVQAAMMLLVGFWLVWARVGSLLRGKVNEADVEKNGWQGWIKNAGDNFNNQFQVPVLFFVLCFGLYLMNAVTPMVMMIAWFFVATRAVHALIHLSVNIINLRFLAFLRERSEQARGNIWL